MNAQVFCSFVLLLCGLSSDSRYFHSYGDVAITFEGLQILSYDRHPWPLNSEGYLACHTYCDTAHPLILVNSEDPDTHTYCRAFSSGAVTNCVKFQSYFVSYGNEVLCLLLDVISVCWSRDQGHQHIPGPLVSTAIPCHHDPVACERE